MFFKTPEYYEVVAKLLTKTRAFGASFLEAHVAPLALRRLGRFGAEKQQRPSAWAELILVVPVVCQDPSGPHRKWRRWPS